ncbi:PREDICTED: polyhomeotic-like protein 2 [Hipposideros armiger]|uniref:Polyhomeotic-like protein 2 n=1 Tax=Hipposideros armiger TaxID=186990 RepID=A0A8B7QS88_HIPAR|nr:PREDICTED: polyhomeotic-like protein 2 [Hipposideros armiger]
MTQVAVSGEGLGLEQVDGLRFCQIAWLLLLCLEPIHPATALTSLVPDSDRYNVGCTKRVGLFHTDRSKLQKAGATTHNRRRASKASLPTLTKDTKKQPTGTVPLSVTAALQLTHSQEDSSRCSDNSSYEEPLSPISASSSTSRRRQGQRDLELPDMHMRDLVGMGHHFLPSEPTKWNVEDVYEFIRSLPGEALGSSMPARNSKD